MSTLNQPAFNQRRQFVDVTAVSSDRHDKATETSSSGHNISWNFDTNGQLKVAFTIKVYYLPKNAQVIVFKKILKFTLKQLRHVSVQSHHLQGAYYPCLLKLHFVKRVSYGSLVAMWLHMLVVSLLMYVVFTMFPVFCAVRCGGGAGFQLSSVSSGKRCERSQSFCVVMWT
jgi:hypothetical protein